MENHDIMIGDWVSLFQCNPDGSSCNVQVTFIGEYGEVGIEGCGEYTSANCNLLFPIPLTSEILEKNGFAYKEADETCATESFHQWHLVGSRFAIDDDSWWRAVKDGELHVKFGGFPLKYVHELQNALRLAGIDKEITI